MAGNVIFSSSSSSWALRRSCFYHRRCCLLTRVCWGKFSSAACTWAGPTGPTRRCSQCTLVKEHRDNRGPPSSLSFFIVFVCTLCASWRLVFVTTPRCRFAPQYFLNQPASRWEFLLILSLTFSSPLLYPPLFLLPLAFCATALETRQQFVSEASKSFLQTVW